MGPVVYKEKDSNLEFLKEINHSKKAVCLLHGYGASMHDLFSLKDVVSKRTDFDWFFLHAPIPLNMGGMLGAAWFPIDMQALELAMQSGGHREFANHYPESLAQSVKMVKTFCENELKDYAEVHIGGFSQGAMVSSHVMSEGLPNLSTLTLMSGNLIGQNELDKKLKNIKPFKFFQSHGSADPVLAFDQAKNLFELLKLNGHQGEFVSFPGGHEIPMEVLRKWDKFLLGGLL